MLKLTESISQIKIKASQQKQAKQTMELLNLKTGLMKSSEIYETLLSEKIQF
jgi:hypothetical protein